MRWHAISMVLLLISTLSILIMKWVSREYEDSALACYMFTVLLAGVAAAAYLCQDARAHVRQIKGAWVAIVSLSMITLLSWVLWGRAIREAPNPGYVNAIVNANTLTTVVLCSIVFGDRLTTQSFVGCFVITLGVWMIVTAQ